METLFIGIGGTMALLAVGFGVHVISERWGEDVKRVSGKLGLLLIAGSLFAIALYMIRYAIQTEDPMFVWAALVFPGAIGSFITYIAFTD